VCAASLLLAGCIYLRLLEFKRQLADFDRNFEVDLRDGVRLTFRKPVLLDGDMDFFRLIPQSRDRVGVAERWHFRWIKAPAVAGEDPDRFAIAADAMFVDHRLTRLSLPERLFVFMPKPLFLSIVRSFGHARVDREQRSASTTVREEFSGDRALRQPSEADLTGMLGAPQEIRETPGGIVWSYRYAAAPPARHAGHIDVAFTLNPATRRVLAIRGNVFGSVLEVVFPDSPAPAAPAHPSPYARS